MAKSLRLLSLRLRNFKGIREFHLDARGGNVSVYGDNATGKTTLDDAFMWLLFDKDSSNRSIFEIKTLGQDGQALHNLEHEVEGTLDADGRPITLRKVYKEKWTRKRGSATDEFTGHTTDLYIDGVPVQLSEYKARVAQIADEATFRLLTDPRYFNEQLHWQKRREILLTVCGDVTDQEVIASDRNLAALPDILGNRTMADHRKVITARRTEINKELNALPVRIDEATRALPEASGSREMHMAEIGRLTQVRQDKAAELARIDNGGELVEKQKRLREIEIDILDLQQRLRAGSDRTVQDDRAKLAGINEQTDAKAREQRRLKNDHADSSLKAELIDAKLQALRREWTAINSREFTLVIEEVCPACGQPLPAEKVEAAREQALAQFNSRKSADLEANVTEGRRLKGELESLQAQQQERTNAIAQVERALSDLTAQANEVQVRIDRLRSEAPDPSQSAEYQQLQREKAQVELEITSLHSGNDTARQTVTTAMGEIDGKIRAEQAEVAKLDQRQQGLARIAELKEQEHKLAAEYERLERELYLTEEFIRAKVRLLEERINSRFQYARFKLFNTQVNGGLEECCETLFQGVPYSTALNTGARTNVGLDIINTLSQHYGFEAPIWIDNSEAVTRLIPVRAQVIRLVVSEPDKRLRVEHETVSALQKEAV